MQEYLLEVGAAQLHVLEPGTGIADASEQRLDIGEVVEAGDPALAVGDQTRCQRGRQSARLGQPQLAEGPYRLCERVLAQRLGLAPGEETRALLRRIGARQPV